ncbi:stress-regulated transcription factor RPN4 [Saccharomyces eubayanus]|uniref:stress-regulated transcription factor RPN4 n=1 Tax=Saccharomyces eubayanus TaxID=1080349 RepID=UPI0006C098BC|nr:RPN4-like protein [Saccharomyces eubayanus]KOH00331.1 RPN4-like protein [Saccharomyces eubayanus]
MASTELSLKRTLTDILEDELYHTNPAHNQFAGHYQNYHPNASITPYKLVNSNKENNNFTWNTAFQQQNESNTASQPPQQTYHFPIFNKYADPTLTTTTSLTNGEATANDKQVVGNNVHLIPSDSKVANETPLQKTVDLKNVMKVSDPYVPTRNTFNYDVKISNDFFDNGDNLYGNDEEVLFYEDNYNPKMQWSLQDNSAAINNEDARTIFNNEFDSDDDDISDDEEDEIEDEDRLQQQEEILLPLDVTSVSIFDADHKINHLKSAGHVFNEYSYVDSNTDDTTNITPKNTLEEQENANAEEGGEEEDNDLLDEDDLYDISLLKNKRKQSFVLNKNTVGFERLSSPSTPVKVPSNTTTTTKRKSTKSFNNSGGTNSNNENTPMERIKKPTSSVSNSNSSRRKLINYTKKHLSSHPTPFSSSPSPTTTSSSAHASSSDGSNEIFACQIMNLISNEPCGAQFSRSYDLTRHQNTIHAKRKIVFRCSECIKILGSEGYQKTFSRLDALTRHIKSKHEDLSSEQRQEVTKFAKANIGYVMG